MTILITQPRVGRFYNEILALQLATRELGLDVVSAPSSWRLNDDLINSGAEGIPYGSQMFCEVIAQQMNWKLKMNSFDWLTKVPKKYLKRQVDFMTLREAKKINVKKFIKPADDKCFDAKIYDVGEFNPSELISDEYPVLVSDIVKFTHEFRCFVRNSEVVTGSCYIWENKIVSEKQYTNYPKLNFDSYFDDPVDLLDELVAAREIESENAVIDIGLIDGRDWAVIETNPAWASGLYGCDPLLALETMKGAVCMM